jgi:hypothetical protein
MAFFPANCPFGAGTWLLTGHPLRSADNVEAVADDGVVVAEEQDHSDARAVKLLENAKQVIAATSGQAAGSPSQQDAAPRFFRPFHVGFLAAVSLAA